MRRDLTIPEYNFHSKLWQLAQSQVNRQTNLSSKLLTKGWRKGTEMHEWMAPAFTRNLDQRLSRPDYGYCVAYKETQNCFGMEGLKKAIIHANDDGDGIIGGWYHEGRFYFDSVKKVGNRVQAENMAVMNGQIGIYHLTTDTFIKTPNSQGIYNLITADSSVAIKDRFTTNKPNRRHSINF